MALYSELDSYLLATNAFTTAPANEITSVKNLPLRCGLFSCYFGCSLVDGPQSSTHHAG